MYILLKKGNTCINKVFKEDYMRRNSRKLGNHSKSLSDKIIIYSCVVVAILAAILIGLLLYSKSLNDNVKEGTMTLEQMANLSKSDEKEDTQSASTEIGKSVEEAKQETNTTNNTSSNTTTSNNVVNSANILTNTAIKANTTNTDKSNATANKTEKKEEQKRELSFAKPVDGEIVKEFAKDNLVYSNTLEEWVTHLGIDIKSEKTTVVKSAEAGKVKSIKNDPRYGLTVVIEHDDGYQTVYSNLLTAEFVVEGEKVEKGQTIGTVGNTASFESGDEAHLHFEILKDSIQVDPSIYIK